MPLRGCFTAGGRFLPPRGAFAGIEPAQSLATPGPSLTGRRKHGAVRDSPPAQGGAGVGKRRGGSMPLRGCFAAGGRFLPPRGAFAGIEPAQSLPTPGPSLTGRGSMARYVIPLPAWGRVGVGKRRGGSMPLRGCFTAGGRFLPPRGAFAGIEPAQSLPTPGPSLTGRGSMRGRGSLPYREGCTSASPPSLPCGRLRSPSFPVRRHCLRPICAPARS